MQYSPCLPHSFHHNIKAVAILPLSPTLWYPQLTSPWRKKLRYLYQLYRWRPNVVESCVSPSLSPPLFQHLYPPSPPCSLVSVCALFSFSTLWLHWELKYFKIFSTWDISVNGKNWKYTGWILFSWNMSYFKMA